MTTVSLFSLPDPGAPPLAADLLAAGCELLLEADCAHLVRDALRSAPDVVLCWAPRPTPDLLQALATVVAQQVASVVVFTADSDAQCMRHALEAGVHAWVVQGYDGRRLRPLLQLAQARAARERGLRQEIRLLQAQLEERKWVDRAKGILMRAQQVSEDEAFGLLRSASQHGNQKVGEVSRQVIAAARIARAINQAGQQRMLSQRLVKLYALACDGTDAAAAKLLMRESVQRVDANLAALREALDAASFGDLVQAAREGWLALRGLLQPPPEATRLPAIDAAAERVLAQADALVRALSTSGAVPQVQVVNVAGRQRMLAQRVAKLALLQGGGAVQGAAALGEAAAAFEQGLATLAAAPLSTPDLRALLAAGEAAWLRLQAAVPAAAHPAGRMAVAAASEELLDVFDRLTEGYQDSLQVLLA